jgi:hypothetical protein
VSDSKLGFFAQDLDEQRIAEKQMQDRCAYIAITQFMSIGAGFRAVALMYAMGGL